MPDLSIVFRREVARLEGEIIEMKKEIAGVKRELLEIQKMLEELFTPRQMPTRPEAKGASPKREHCLGSPTGEEVRKSIISGGI